MTEKGNTNALKHGAEAAIKRLEDGGPFAPIAADELERVENQLEVKGVAALQEINATRIQTACNLYWTAIEKAAQDHDLAALDKFCARYGWLVGVATRAWVEVQKNSKDKRQTLDMLLGKAQGTHQDATQGTQSANGIQNEVKDG
jgi:hypothetical protein